MLAWASGTEFSGSWVGEGGGGVANRHSRHCPYPERKEDKRDRKRPGMSG